MQDIKIVLLSLFLLAAQCCYAAEQNKSPIMHDVYSQAPTQDYLEFQLFDNLEDDDLSFFSLLEDSGDGDDEKNSFETDENEMQIFLQDWDDDLLESLLNDYETEQTRLQSDPRKKNRINKNILNDYTPAGAVEAVLRLNNISIETFNELSAYKKITLLLQVTEEEYSYLPAQEQKVLDKLRENRKEVQRLDAERHRKRRLQKSSENIPDFLQLNSQYSYQLPVQEEDDLHDFAENYEDYLRLYRNHKKNEKFNARYAHVIQIVTESGEVDKESFDRLEKSKKFKLLFNLTPEQRATLSMQEQEDLEYLKERHSAKIQAKKNYDFKFNNDLYVNAIERVLEQKNMSIDAFNQLRAYKKVTLLLQLTEENSSQVPQQEQEALHKLREDRKKLQRLDTERHRKRELEQKLNNEREEFNKQYLHAIELIIDAGKIDRASFHALESSKKLELLLNLTSEQRATLSMQEQEDLEYLKERDARQVQANKNYAFRFNNDLHANAIERVLEQKNMSVEAFHELSRERKITLLLQLTEEYSSQLAQHEQEALHKLREDREENNRLSNERQRKRRWEQKLNNEPEEFNKQYLHAIELIIDAGKIDRASFHALESDKKLELLLDLTPEQVERLPIDDRQNLENLQEKHVLQKKADKIKKPKFNDLYANAIERVVEHNNMSVDAFHELSRERKITLLLQLTEEYSSQLAQHEQEALHKLREDRKEINRLDAERKRKRELEQKLNNEREEFNKQYLHAIELIIDAGKIDRASFHVLESDKKLELLLNLTPEQLEKLPINERKNLQLQEKINGLRKRQKLN